MNDEDSASAAEGESEENDEDFASAAEGESEVNDEDFILDAEGFLFCNMMSCHALELRSM